MPQAKWTPLRKQVEVLIIDFLRDGQPRSSNEVYNYIRARTNLSEDNLRYVVGRALKMLQGSAVHGHMIEPIQYPVRGYKLSYGLKAASLDNVMKNYKKSLKKSTRPFSIFR